MPQLSGNRSLRSNVAAAIISAREASAEGRFEDAKRYLDLALTWLAVPQDETERKLARIRRTLPTGRAIPVMMSRTLIMGGQVQ